MGQVNKSELIAQVIANLEQDLKSLIAAAQANLEAATNEESKPENEYDTRALEAGYIAGAQSQRARETEEAILSLRQLKPRDFQPTETVQMTALVTLQGEKDQSLIFLLPRGAGQIMNWQGQKIKIISGQSPLGLSLLNQKVGDVVSVETAKGLVEYEVLNIQ